MNKLAEVVVLTLAADFALKISSLRGAKEKVANSKKACELAKAKSLEAKMKALAAHAATVQAIEEVKKLQADYLVFLNESKLAAAYADATLDEAQLATEEFLAARFEANEELEKAVEEKLAASKAATAKLDTLGAKDRVAYDAFIAATALAKSKSEIYDAAANESIRRAEAEVEAAAILLAAQEAYSFELAAISSVF